MSAVAKTVDTESMLVQWGRWANRMAHMLGYPKHSSIARMAEEVEVHGKAHKTPVRGADDAERKAVSRGWVEPRLTARGKQKRSMRPMEIGDVPADVWRVEIAVAKLPGFLAACAHRTYRYGQPDRKAAQDLKIPKGIYRARREMMVAQVAERLDTSRKIA